MSFTTHDRLVCAERELARRKRVFPNRVHTGRMSEDQAKREIAIMETIVAVLRCDEEAERLL